MISENKYRQNKENSDESDHISFPTLPFIDRIVELTYLQDCIEKVRNREGSRLVFLSGEAGIGKTRLAQELVTLANSMGYRCLKARCRSDAGAPLYFPWMEVLRQFSEEASAQLFFKICGTYIDQIVRLVPELFNSVRPSGSSSSSYFSGSKDGESQVRWTKTVEDIQKDEMRFLHALTDVFFRLSEDSPLLLVLDDMQWCDASSLKVLEFFTSKLQKTRILFLCLYRDADLQQSLSPEFTQLIQSLKKREGLLSSCIRLARFDQDNVAELVSEVFDVKAGQNANAFPRLLHSRTGGNPLFINETLKSLVEDKIILRNKEGKWASPQTVETFQLPDTIRSVIELRLERLDYSTLRVLRVASVVGEQFSLEILRKILASVADNDGLSLETCLQKAVLSGLVLTTTDSSQDSAYVFSDEWVKDVLYDELDQLVRERYHLAAAWALENYYAVGEDGSGKDHFLELAHHYLKGGDRGKAREFFIKSAKRAAELYAHQESFSRYGKALDLLECSNDTNTQNLALQATLLKNMGDEAQFLPQYEKTLGCWKKSAELYERCGERLKAADVLVRLGMAYHLVMYELEASEEAFQKAVELAKQDSNTPSAELARLNAYAITTDVWRSDRQKVKERSTLALKLAKESEAYDVLAMVSSYGIGTDLVGEIDKSIESCNRGLKIARAHNLMWEGSYNYFHRACVHNYTYGPSRKSEELFLEGLNFTQSKRNFMVNLFHKTELVYGVYLPLGEWKKAKQMALESLDSVKVFPPTSLFCLIAESAMGHVLLHEGDLDRAYEYLDHVRRSTKGFGVLQLDVPLYIALARLKIAKGDLDKAKEHLDEGYRLSKQRGLTVVNGIPHIQLLTLMIEHFVARWEKSEGGTLRKEENRYLGEKLAELAEASEKINKEWPSAYVYRAEGLIAQERGDRKRALDLLEKSLSIFQKLNWPFEVAKAQYLLGEAHLRRGNILSSMAFLDFAISGFSKLGAKLDIERAVSLRKTIEDQDIPLIEEHPRFQNKDSELVFENLKTKFMEDLMFENLGLDQCGWRSLSELLRDLKISKYAFYGRSEGAKGPILKELLSLSVIETRIFLGLRGRGGEIMKIRIVHKKKRNEGLR